MVLMLTLVAAMLQPPAAPKPSTSTTTTVPAMKTIDKGDHSNMDDGKQLVVKTDRAWTQLWQQHTPDRPRPQVDFTKEMVLGVFMGSRPTAGYTLEIVGTAENNGTLVVRYREAAPGRGMMTAQVVTSPYQIVAVPFFPGEVTFEKVEK
jgi:hypothetical protein